MAANNPYHGADFTDPSLDVFTNLAAMPLDKDGFVDVNQFFNDSNFSPEGENSNNGVAQGGTDNAYGPPPHYGAPNGANIDPSFLDGTMQGQYIDVNGQQAHHSQYPDPTSHDLAPAPYPVADIYGLPQDPNFDINFFPNGSAMPNQYNKGSFSVSPRSNQPYTGGTFQPYQFQQNENSPMFVPNKPTPQQHTDRRSSRRKTGRVSYADLNNGDFDFSDPEDNMNGDQGPSKKTRITAGAQRFNPEKPKKDYERPWIRTNGTTKGLSSRTGKINNFESPYDETAHPFNKRLQTPHFSFNFNNWGELHSTAYSADALREFIYSHPFNQPGYNGPGKLILWIQKTPGDSVRRFPTQASDKCRFDPCPCRCFKSRTIGQGHFRVAIDEQWGIYGDGRDPMHVAGYAHLYCVERFLDFADLCYRFDVRADDRDIPSEPTGEWKASLGRETEECRLVKSFIEHAKSGTLAQGWPGYPVHGRYAKGAPKHHAATLTKALYEAKIETTGRSKMQMMRNRGENATMFFVNLGDLEMQVQAQRERSKGRAKHKGAAGNASLQLTGSPALLGDDAQLAQQATRNTWDFPAGAGGLGGGAGTKRKAGAVDEEDEGRNTRQRPDGYATTANTAPMYAPVPATNGAGYAPAYGNGDMGFGNGNFGNGGMGDFYNNNSNY